MKKYLKTLITVMILFFTGMRMVLAEEPITITFHSGNEGKFEDESTENVVTFVPTMHYEKYSHTSNVDDTGKKLSNYGNNWTNANITGTDRGSTSNAHVIKISDADSLTVDLYFNGESVSYDWLSVFAGEYPSYTASNYNSTGKVTTEMGAPNSTNKFGASALSGVTFGTYTVNGNTLNKVGHVTLTIPGNAVTFAFKSDSSGVGQGYGYYAIVSADATGIVSGEYKEPLGYEVGDDTFKFKEWHDNPELTGSPIDPFTVTSDMDLYAEYEEDVIAQGTYGCAWKIKGDGTLVIGKDGESCTLNSPTSVTNWPWYNNSTIKKAEFKGTVIGGNSLAGMFYKLTSLQNVDFSGFSTVNVTNMTSMFSNCNSLAALDLSSFDTSRVTNMASMFYSCYSLGSLNLSGVNTANVTDMSDMFYGCRNLRNIDLSGFNTSKVSNMYSMFDECYGLGSLDLSNFDTSNVTVMEYMFHNCYGLNNLNISAFDTSNVVDMSDMFSNCYSLRNLDLSNFNTSKVTDMRYMFSNCYALNTPNLSSFDTSNVLYMNYMFNNCYNLPELDLSGFDTSKVTDMNYMFYNCRSLNNLDISNFNTSNVTNMEFMFSDCYAIQKIEPSSFDTSKVEKMSNMFANCYSLREVDVSNFDTSNVTSMAAMFNNCYNLSEIDVSNFNTSKVTYLSQMFANCYSLKKLNLSGFNTSSVTNMSTMFSNDNSLSSIFLPSVFSFEGTNKPLLPTPPTAGWKRVYDANNLTYDNSGTLYSSEQIRDNWNPNEMAGLWVWDVYDMSSSGFGDETKIHSSDPKWTQLNETTWKYTFDVFDDSLDYYVTEDILPGFISDIPADPGYIKTNNKEAHITNTTTTETGSLTVTKNVIGNEGVYDKFTFIITLNGPGIGGTQVLDGVVFKDGVGKIQLRRGESKTINGLIEGVTYTVEEEPLEGYEGFGTNTEGTIIKEGSLVQFENSYVYDTTFTPEDEDDDPNKGGFVLRKTVEDSYGVAQEEFGYIVELRGLTANANYSYAKETDGGTFTTVPFTSNSDGSALVEVNLKKDKTIYFPSLPLNAEFRVTELGGNYYASYAIEGTGPVVKKNDAASAKNTNLSTQWEKVDPSDAQTYINVNYTNVYEEFRNLSITKAIAQDTNARFEFTVSLRGLKPNAAYNSSIGRIIADDEGEAEKTFYLSKDQTVTIEALPVGTEYSVTESPSVFVASYAIDGADSAANTQPNKELSTGFKELGTSNAQVTFTNSVETSTLTLEKTVEDGEPEELEKEFEFTINLKNGEDTAESRAMPVAGTFDYTGTKTGSITFNNAGNGTVTLKHGDSIVIGNIPVGTVYTVTENDYTEEDFTVTSTGETGKIQSGGKSKATFVNKKASKSQLTISKTVSGNLGDKSKDFKFTIELQDKNNNPISGSYPYSGDKSGTLTFTDGTAEINLKHGESITITELKVGTKYTVTEDNYGNEGYSTVYQNNTGTIVKEGNTASFENINSVIVPSGLYIDRNTITLGALGLIGLIAFVVMKIKKRKKIID